METDVDKWIKRLSRKGPFYLVDTNTDTAERWDHSAYDEAQFAELYYTTTLH